jgi:type VI secretion system protein ImpM
VNPPPFAAEQIAIGWHGKLPTVGDFVTRRLDVEFVSHWDQWVSRGLTDLRRHWGSCWLDHYLRSPTWRFLLTPGFMPSPINKAAWVGVLMPSVDRVGRYYPLTLAAPLAAVPDRPETQADLWIWMRRLEDVAIDALEGDWSVDALEAGLVALGLPPDPSEVARDGFAGLEGGRAAVEMMASSSMKPFFAAASRETDQLAGCGRCVWYSVSANADPRLFVSRSLDDSLAELWRVDPDNEACGA